MAAPPARARADYDYLIKLLLIGDSGELAEPLASPSSSDRAGTARQPGAPLLRHRDASASPLHRLRFS